MVLPAMNSDARFRTVEPFLRSIQEGTAKSGWPVPADRFVFAGACVEEASFFLDLPPVNVYEVPAQERKGLSGELTPEGNLNGDLAEMNAFRAFLKGAKEKGGVVIMRYSVLGRLPEDLQRYFVPQGYQKHFNSLTDYRPEHVNGVEGLYLEPLTLLEEACMKKL